MGKRASKKQKLEQKAVQEVEPLGAQNAAALLDDAAKDDEERRLESLLFGTKYVPAPSNEHVLVLSDDDDDDDEDILGGGTEFQAVADTDVRTRSNTQMTRAETRTVVFRRRFYRRSVP